MLPQVWTIAISVIGFLLGAAGGLGAELLDRFMGRSLEAFCRLRGRRELFGEVLDQHDEAMHSAEYLRSIGNVLFLTAGTASIVAGQTADGNSPGIDAKSFLIWAFVACITVMLMNLWLPAAVTRFASAPLLYRTWPFWRGLSLVMRPLAFPGMIVAAFTRRVTGSDEDDTNDEEVMEDEIRTIVAAGTREGVFGPGVREMIQGVIDLHDDPVRHIMTVRSDVDAIEIDTPWPEVMKVVVESGRTRLPVYRGKIDNVEGVLYVKDLLGALDGVTEPEVPLAKLIRKAWTVPMSKRVDELLQEFLHSRSHMAIVIDEHQQVAGVVTIEDALEEIVGEIVDESDDDEQVDFNVLDRTTADLSGRVMVDEVNDRLGWDVPESEDYETIAGYVLHEIGYIPQKDEQIQLGPFSVKILRASSLQIERLRLHNNNMPALEAS